MTVLCAARLYRVKDLVFMLPSAPVKGGGLWLVVVVLCELLLVFPHLSSALSAATPNNSVSYAVSWLGKNSHDFEDVTYGDSIRQRTTVELWSSCNCDPWGAALPDSKLYILPTMTKWPLMTYKPLSEFVIIRIILISQFRTRFHLEQLIWLNNRSCQSYALALCVYHIFFSCYTIHPQSVSLQTHLAAAYNIMLMIHNTCIAHSDMQTCMHDSHNSLTASLLCTAGSVTTAWPSTACPLQNTVQSRYTYL